MPTLSPSLKEQYPQMNVSQLPNNNVLCKNNGRCLAVQGEISFVKEPGTGRIVDIKPRLSIESCLSCTHSTI